MKIIIIESAVYRCSDKTYREIRAKTEEIKSKKWYLGQDLDICEYLESIMDKLKHIGTVNFDFRL